MRIQLLPDNPEIGKSPYFWLIYLGYFIVPLFIRPPTLYKSCIAIAIVVVFLALNFRGYWLTGAALWRNALMITALGVIAAPSNFGASVFFVYSACSGGGFGRTREGIALIAVNVMLAILTTFTFHLRIDFWLSAIIFPIVVGGPVLYFSEIGRARSHLLRKQEEVEHMTKIAERERIARDLHDVLGHTLSMITLKSELAQKLIRRDPTAAEREMHEVEVAARETLQQVREAITGYRSTGWIFELAQAQKILSTSGVALDVDVEPLSLSPQMENVLSLVLREAVTNIVRHAHASRCRIMLHQGQDTIYLNIEDNGVGVLAAPAGNGLKGMRERVEFIGGKLSLLSAQPGLRITLSLPRQITT